MRRRARRGLEMTSVSNGLPQPDPSSAARRPAPVAIGRALGFAFLLSLGTTYASYAIYEVRVGNWAWTWTFVDFAEIRTDEGLAFVAPTGRPELSSHERRSAAVVFEDGRPMLPADDGIEQIRRVGLGHYVFWYGLAYFAPSDNSNPAHNGHRYSFGYPPVTRPVSWLFYQTTAVAWVTTAALLLIWLSMGGDTRTLVSAVRSAINAASIRWSSRIVRAMDEPHGLPRSLIVAGGAAALLVLVALGFIEPGPTLSGIGRGFGWMVFALLAGAAGAQLIDVQQRRIAPGIGAARVVTLLALALFVWVKAAFRAWPTLIDVLTLMAPFVVFGMLRQLWLPALSRGLGRRLVARLPRIDALLVTAAVVLAMPMAAGPIARNWDVSGWMDSHSYEIAAANIATGKVPQGISEYMPVYQYGMGTLYWVFGHFFFVQQLANLLLILLAVAALCRAAWVLFGSRAAVAVAGVCAAFAEEFYYPVHFTQIESWYLPIICFMWLAWARYWRSPTGRNLAVLALCVALGLNTRNQGAIFFAVICMTPLVVPLLHLRSRVVHLMACGVMVGLSLLPWTIRNYVVEGRLSPVGSRTSVYIGVLNDRRVGLYGIRYWDGWQEVVDEYNSRYPDARDREKALMEAGWRLTIMDPVWTATAVFYRSLGFYGLLPDGMLQSPKVVATDWSREWQGYAFWRLTPLLFIPLSILGLLFRFSRLQAFLITAAAAGLSIMVVSATSEPRLSYPVLPSHILLIAGLFSRKPGIVDDDAPPHRQSPAPADLGRRAAMATTFALIIVVACRLRLGSRFAYRPLIEQGFTIEPGLELRPGLLRLEDLLRASSGVSNPPENIVGQHVAFRCMVSNNMYPPKFAGQVPNLPAFATDPNRETYYYASVLNEANPPAVLGIVAVSFRGAVFNRVIREGEAVEVEGEVLALQTLAGTAPAWIRVTHARALGLSPSYLPPYP